MPFEPVNDLQDARLADYREIGQPDRLREKGLFVAEGRLVLQRIVADRRYIVRSVLVSDTASRSLEPALQMLPATVPVYTCHASYFSGLTGHNIHRGCLALVVRPDPASLDELLTKTRVLVVLEAVANPDNIGGVFRNAAAFGAGGVLLSPTCSDPLYRKAVRTSMAATLRVPWVALENWPAPLGRLKAHGFEVIALTPHARSNDLSVFAAKRRGSTKLALLVGTEGEGLTEAAHSWADHRVCIPISPEIDSLNLAVATGIALYALSKRA